MSSIFPFRGMTLTVTQSTLISLKTALIGGYSSRRSLLWQLLGFLAAVLQGLEIPLPVRHGRQVFICECVQVQLAQDDPLAEADGDLGQAPKEVAGLRVTRGKSRGVLLNNGGKNQLLAFTLDVKIQYIGL